MGQETRTCPCLFCARSFNIEEKNEDLLAHLIMVHKFVIADVSLICNLRKYILYWKERLKDQSLSDFCSVIVTNTASTDIGEREEFFMLCDVLPEDKEFRQFLQKEKLEEILSQQQKERNDVSFCRMCLFCSESFEKNRADLFNHMAEDHAFNVGRPDNLVFTNEFLDLLQEKLRNLQCLYCEKTFKDRPTLKEHMRKKQHRKINPKNKAYDKFYVINYQELGKNWESIQSEDDALLSDTDDTDENEEDDWSDWMEEAGSQAVCLFCEFSSSHSDRLHAHMQELHDFNLHEQKIKMNLTFYQKIKLINFIRRKVNTLSLVIL
ncbi:zinc finger protein 277-like [Gigantopelta aegis]|uniref:zinc finger protein 277-like n=1 Tax=Gigantopelta aegis TaxID=1735272 RepID=UPI001B887B37|nr:zinc finger protein 277-like [Gigantopelta aegis]